MNEYRMKMKSGEYRWVNDTARVIERDENGSALRMTGVTYDITERKQAEDTLRVSEEKWRSLFEILPVGVSIVDAENGVTELNPALAKILDISEAGLLKGKYKDRKYLRSDKTPMPAEEFPSARTVKEKKIIQNVEIGIEKENGAVIWTNVSAAPLSSGVSAVVVTADITEHKRAEETLQKSEATLKKVQEIGHMGSWEIDLATKMVTASAESQRIYGIPEDSVTLAYVQSAPLPEFRPALDAALTALITKGEQYDVEFKIQRLSDGEIRALHSIAEYDASRQMVIGSMQDITERKQAEEALRESEEKFRAVTEQSHSGIILVDEQGIIIEWNRAHEQITGIMRTEAIGQPVWDIQYRQIAILHAPQFTVERLKQILLKMLETGQSAQFNQVIELPLQTASGEQRITLQNAFSIKTDKGYRLCIIFQDITERKQAENALQEIETRFREVLENSLDASYKRNLQTDAYDYMSPVFNHIMGYTMDEMNTMPIETVLGLIHPDDQAEIDRVITESMSGAEDTSYQVDYRFKHKDGEYRWLHDQFVVMCDAQGQPVARIGSVADITERRQADDKLRHTRQFLRSIQDALSANLAVLDEDGVIIQINSNWREFGKANGLKSMDYCLGLNYLEICDSAEGDHAEEARLVAQAIRDMLAGEKKEAQIEYPCHSPNEKRWFLLHMTTFENGDKAWVVMSHENITERKQMEEALRANEKRLYLATTTGNIGIWDWDVVKDKLVWEDSMYSLYGIRKEDFNGAYEVWSRALHPDDRQFAEEEIQAALRGEREYAPEFRIVRPDGDVRILKAASQTIRDQDGKALRMIGTNIDITERKRAENKLRKLSRAVEQSPASIVITDLDGNIEYVNPRFTQVTGYSFNEAIEKNPRILKTDLTPPETHRQLWETIKAGKEWHGEFVNHKKDGSLYTESATISPITDLNGVATHYLAIKEDITKRKQIEEALRDAHWRIESIIEGTQVGTWEWNVQTGETIFNEKWANIIGYTLDELAPISIKTWEKFAHPDDLKQSAELLERHFASELPNYEYESRMKHKDGHWVWILDRGRVITHTSDGKPLMMFGTHQDITAHKHTEEALVLAHDQAVKANQLKSQLIAKVSHELRTPLGSVLGFAELLKYGSFGEIDAEQMEAADRIIESAHYLTDMVSEFLDEAELETKSLLLEHKPFSIATVLKHAESVMSILAHKKGLALTTYLAPDLPETIWGDERRLQQVIINLTGNAIKFTRTGEVSIQMLCHSKNQWIISIKDTGAGIPKDAQGLIFEPFKQIDNAITRENQGTGLGLTITKQIVDLMSGRILVESEVGKGSTFSVILPIRQDPTKS